MSRFRRQTTERPEGARRLEGRLRPMVPCALTAAALALSFPRPSARAEDSIAYIFENYREEDGRITVVTESSSVNEDVAAYGHIQLSGTIDAVTGATPTGRPAQAGSDQVALAQIQTRRKAWNGDYSEQVGNLNIDAAFAQSREDDYVSTGWSVNTLTDFNQKNTTVRAGIAGTSDRVEVIFEPGYLPKHTADAIVGITQLLSPTTFVTLDVSAGRSTGYLSEPYKIVEKAVEILPSIFLDEEFAENSPNVRDKESAYVAINRSFSRMQGAVEGSYRFYTDSYGIVAHTLQLSWLQHVGQRLVLSPNVRFYTQTAARFYYYDIDQTSIMPARVPMGTAPYYTADFRLSAEESVGYGLKASWKASDWLHVDASYERYVLRGRDGVTPQSAYPTAGISTLGVKFLW